MKAENFKNGNHPFDHFVKKPDKVDAKKVEDALRKKALEIDESDDRQKDISDRNDNSQQEELRRARDAVRNTPVRSGQPPRFGEQAVFSDEKHVENDSDNKVSKKSSSGEFPDPDKKFSKQRVAGTFTYRLREIIDSTSNPLEELHELENRVRADRRGFVITHNDANTYIAGDASEIQDNYIAQLKRFDTKLYEIQKARNEILQGRNKDYAERRPDKALMDVLFESQTKPIDESLQAGDPVALLQNDGGWDESGWRFRRLSEDGQVTLFQFGDDGKPTKKTIVDQMRVAGYPSMTAGELVSRIKVAKKKKEKAKQQGDKKAIRDLEHELRRLQIIGKRKQEKHKIKQQFDNILKKLKNAGKQSTAQKIAKIAESKQIKSRKLEFMQNPQGFIKNPDNKKLILSIV